MSRRIGVLCPWMLPPARARNPGPGGGLRTEWGSEMRPFHVLPDSGEKLPMRPEGHVGAGPVSGGRCPRKLPAPRIWKSLADLKAHTGCASWCRFLIKMYRCRSPAAAQPRGRRHQQCPGQGMGWGSCSCRLASEEGPGLQGDGGRGPRPWELGRSQCVSEA